MAPGIGAAHDELRRGVSADRVGPGAVTTAYAYDLAGNLLSESAADAVTTYAYDGENRLVAPSGASAYAYQADGLRRSAQEPGGTLTTFVWDGQDLLQERS